MSYAFFAEGAALGSAPKSYEQFTVTPAHNRGEGRIEAVI